MVAIRQETIREEQEEQQKLRGFHSELQNVLKRLAILAVITIPLAVVINEVLFPTSQGLLGEICLVPGQCVHSAFKRTATESTRSFFCVFTKTSSDVSGFCRPVHQPTTPGAHPPRKHWTKSRMEVAERARRLMESR
eukprot:1610361-Rhodomonas_salina.5